jgi:hypothetical protein
MRFFVRVTALIFTIAAAGCSTMGTSKVAPLTDAAVQSHQGNIDGVWDDWLKRQGCQSAGDNSWSEYAQCVIPFGASWTQVKNDVEATEGSVIDAFKRVCEASNARVFVIDQHGGKYLECTDSSTNDSFASVKTIPENHGLSVYFKSPRITRELERARQEKQAAQQKADDNYRYNLLANPDALGMDSLARLTVRFKDNDPRNYLPAAQKRLNELRAEAAREAKRAQEQRDQIAAAARSRQEHREIGDRVCHAGDDISVKRPTGDVLFGQVQYRTINGTVMIVAYVEGKAGYRLQLRISGLNFNSGGDQNEALSELDNYQGSTLRINNIIWDSAYNWVDCP